MAGRIAIEALVHELPPVVVTSAELEAAFGGTLDRLGIPGGTLEALTGIRERRFWEPGTTPSRAATGVARRAIDVAGVDPALIGCVVSTSVSRDYLEPSVASLVHGNLGLSASCRCFDLCNACLGFMEALDLVELMIADQRFEYALVVDAESAREPVEATVGRLARGDTTVCDYRESFATLTVGSGAAAIVVRDGRRTDSGHWIQESINVADTRHTGLCVAQRDGARTDSPALLAAGIGLAREAWREATSRFPAWAGDAVDLYVPHQVSVRHTREMIAALDLSPDKVVKNVDSLGNIGPAAIPISLSLAIEAGRLAPGMQAVLLGIGSGLSCMGMRVTW